MEKKKLGTKWKVLIVVGCVLLVIIGVGVGALVWMMSGLSTYQKMPIGKVDLSKVKDGTFTGNFSGGRFSNTVSVTVKDHKITGIEVVKAVGSSSDETTRQLFEKVVAQQTPQVDTITGATVTGKAYLKAIENALNGGK